MKEDEGAEEGRWIKESDGREGRKVKEGERRKVNEGRKVDEGK